ncbi:MAG TPA: ester cyclase [Puia sp.]|jgi:predicted SnoaL-like aldol condensation-catalyzing enzyme|nr:ester cyclase [Puia sp.]
MKKNLSWLPAIACFCISLNSCNNSNDPNPGAQLTIDSLNMQIKSLKDSLNQNASNKKMVADFYQELFGDKNQAAIDQYVSDTYIQHNPSLSDGKDALKKAVTVWFKGQAKDTVDVKHLGADGNFVYIHTKSKMGNKTYSILDIFRLENGKIAEHWDVMQEVPAKSANAHPMF